MAMPSGGRDALNKDAIGIYSPHYELPLALEIKRSKELAVNVPADFFHVWGQVYCVQP
jgi:hypothetical protein